ncbi:20063_t:CDS:2 [Funneliformis geosporum]|uniref:20063_t:CDS:1 n=1 Tax=Funneliformis geosporum TaxID=1117311 RepID=A0A9W4SB36_9GLOM|nr:20063_t:CDS:2 [Funneliformis geosporum]
MAVAYTKPLCTAGSSHPYLLDAKDSLKTGVRNTVCSDLHLDISSPLGDELPDVIKKLRLILEPISGNVSYHVIAGTTELGRPQWSGRVLGKGYWIHWILIRWECAHHCIIDSSWTAQAFFCPGCLRKRSQKIQAKNGTPPVLNPQHK